MSEVARVESVDALKELRVALIKFAETANGALGDSESEVQRMQMWLENDQTSHWQRQIRKLTEVVSRAKEALRMKKVFKDATGFQGLVRGRGKGAGQGDPGAGGGRAENGQYQGLGPQIPEGGVGVQGLHPAHVHVRSCRRSRGHGEARPHDRGPQGVHRVCRAIDRNRLRRRLVERRGAPPAESGMALSPEAEATEAAPEGEPAPEAAADAATEPEAARGEAVEAEASNPTVAEHSAAAPAAGAQA